MVPSPEQFIHPLGTGHLANVSALNQNCNTFYYTFDLKPQLATTVPNNFIVYYVRNGFWEEHKLYDSICEIKLSSFCYWSQRCKIRWKNGKILLICGFLLEVPLSLWIAPYSPADDTRSRSTLFHPDKMISDLEQIFDTRVVESGEMVRWNNKLRNPNVF
jgi:hypothetical protein